MWRRCAIALLLLVTRGAIGQTPAPLLAPLVEADGRAGPPAPWRLALLPRQTAPHTRFAVMTLDGEQVLRIDASSSYGNLVHALSMPAGAGPLFLTWRWRVERFADGTNLRVKAGDDTALKVCAMFDLPMAQVPFVERTLLRLMRTRSGEPLPAATVCYVWDRSLPPASELRNAFTARMRYVVLQGPQTPPGHWRSERRDVAADFLRLFGDEAREVPPLVAIAVGADADNTKSESRAYLSDLKLER